MNRKSKEEVREIIDEVRDAVIYGDTDAACDGLDQIVRIIEEDD